MDFEDNILKTPLDFLQAGIELESVRWISIVTQMHWWKANQSD